MEKKLGFQLIICGGDCVWVGRSVMMAKSFCTCCGDVLPVVIILCAGLDMLMSSTTSRNLFVVSGCDHKSIILVESLHVGIASIPGLCSTTRAGEFGYFLGCGSTC